MTKLCVEEDCNDLAKCKDRCSPHYSKWRRLQLKLNPAKPECKVEGCYLKEDCRGFCTTHYNQVRRGKVPYAFAQRGKLSANERHPEPGKQLCTKCDRILPIDQFFERGEGIEGKTRAHCRKCNILRRMGITSKEYYAILESQNGHCAICSATESNNGRELVVDHDHGCCGPKKACKNCIRALLCDPCNTAIGMLKDNSALAKRAADYLERFGK
jgi:hypothetical protein